MKQTRYTSSDGLMSSSDPEAVALWESICAKQASEQAQWSELLREFGVKLEHPDDGWVHPTIERLERGDGSIRPSYPRFDLQPQVGDLIALGAPYQTGTPWKYRIVEVTKVESDRGILMGNTNYHFRDTGRRLPEPPPQPGHLRRLLANMDISDRWYPR